MEHKKKETRRRIRTTKTIHRFLLLFHQLVFDRIPIEIMLINDTSVKAFRMTKVFRENTERINACDFNRNGLTFVFFNFCSTKRSFLIRSR